MLFGERSSPEEKANEQATARIVNFGEQSSNKKYANFVHDVRGQFYSLGTLNLIENKKITLDRHLRGHIRRSKLVVIRCMYIVRLNISRTHN